MEIKNIILDQDGVLADFTSLAIEKLNAATGKTYTLSEYAEFNEFNMDKVYKITIKRFWQIIESDPEFWSKLKPMPWAYRLITQLEKIAPITICTSPSSNPSCFAQKAKWLMNFGFSSTQLMIGSRKYLLANKGNVLIDDLAKNIAKFTEAGGKGILIPSNWNHADLTFEKVWEVIDKNL